MKPLVHAARYGSTDMVKILLRLRGADINETEHQTTALMAAAERGHADTVALLLEKGADPNLQDSSNITALIYAAKNGDVANIKLLITAGARLAECGKNKTILDYDFIKKDPEMKGFIIDTLSQRIQTGYKNKKMEADEFKILNCLSALPEYKDHQKVKETVRLFNDSAIEQITGVLEDASIPIHKVEEITQTDSSGKSSTLKVRKELDKVIHDPNHTLGQTAVATHLLDYLTIKDLAALSQVKLSGHKTTAEISSSKSQPKDVGQTQTSQIQSLTKKIDEGVPDDDVSGDQNAHDVFITGVQEEV